MRWVIWSVGIAGMAWGGWWYIAAQGAERFGHAGFEALRAEGYAAAHAGIKVQGFPNRVDLTITAPELASPDGQMSWRSDFLQLFSLSYKPWHVIATVAPEQRLRLPAGELVIDSPRLRASVVSRPSTDLPLERFALEAEPIALTLDGVPIVSADKANLASRATPALPGAHDIGVRLDGLRLAVATGGLPSVIEALLIEARAELDAPLDRHASARPPRLDALSLHNLHMIWGEVRVQGEGRIAPDARGLTEGEITLRLRNWRLLLPVLVESGLIAPEFRPNLETALSFLSQRDNEGAETLTLPLRMAGGATTLGPLPLGPAPVFPGRD